MKQQLQQSVSTTSKIQNIQNVAPIASEPPLTAAEIDEQVGTTASLRPQHIRRTEAEFVAAALCTCQALWLRNILEEMQFKQLGSTRIF